MIFLGFHLVAALWLSPPLGEKALITRYPAWPYHDYQRIAVVPFGAPNPRAAQAAATLTERTITALSRSGAFTVLSRTELKDVLTEQDFSQLSDLVDPATVILPGRIKAAQAIVVGRLTQFDIARDRVERRVPRLALDRFGRIVRDSRGRTKLLREDVVPIFRHEARVAGTLRVVNASTGEILFSHDAEPIIRAAEAEGRPPARSTDDLAAEALDRLASEFAAQLVPLSLTVKMHSDMLVVATGFFDGEYDKADKVYLTDEKFLVAVRGLPPECDQNRFRIGIALDDAKENILEREFIWDAAAGDRGIAIEIPTADLAPLLKARKAKFYAKLYSGRDTKPLLDRSFRLYREE